MKTPVRFLVGALLVTTLASCDPYNAPNEACVENRPYQYPTPETTGVPEGWEPTGGVIQGDLNIEEDKAQYYDIEVHGDINVKANEVFLCRVRVHGRVWTQHNVGNGLEQFSVRVEDSSLGENVPGYLSDEGLIGPGRYSIVRSELYGSDGFRISGDDVLIRSNFFRSNIISCDTGSHLDGVQGYFGGQEIVVEHNTLDVRQGCGVTGAVFFADDSESALIKNNLLISAGYVLTVNDDHVPDVGPWTVTGNRLMSVGYGPVRTVGTECEYNTMLWEDNRTVVVDSAYKVISVGEEVPCG